MLLKNKSVFGAVLQPHSCNIKGFVLVSIKITCIDSEIRSILEAKNQSYIAKHLYINVNTAHNCKAHALCDYVWKK